LKPFVPAVLQQDDAPQPAGAIARSRRLGVAAKTRIVKPPMTRTYGGVRELMIGWMGDLHA